jgi:UDP-GlcNAc:undecaprenyl-phosphate GlcNAc-1-phosphate transferase
MILAYSFFVGLFVTVIAVALLWRTADRFGVIDHPGPRKIHTAPVPRIGGIAIAVGAFTSILLWVPVTNASLAYLGGAAIIVLTGIWDDVRTLNYKWKILGQTLGIGVLLGAGLPLDEVTILGLGTMPAYVAYPAALAFIFFVTNAFNLFDGLDGLAGGCFVLSIGAISFFALSTGDTVIPIIGFALIGGIFGFLRFNSHPARIFMGDAGSQYLGFTAGYLALLLVTRANTALPISLPVLILGLPLLDTISVSIRRILQKRSPFIGDKQHLHHRLLARGLTHAQTVTVLYALQIVMVGSSFLMRYQGEVPVTVTFASLGVAIFAILYSIERRGLAWASASEAHFAGYPLLNRPSEVLSTLFRRGEGFAAILISAFFLFGAILALSPARDVALLCLGVSLVTTIAAFLGGRARVFFFRFSAYGAAVTICFLLIRGGANSSIWDNWAVNLFLTVLGLIVLVSITFHPHNDFRLSPQDLLMALIVIVVPTLDLDRQFNFPVSIFLLQISVLFYAVEFVLSTKDKVRILVPISAVLGLAILAADGFLH